MERIRSTCSGHGSMNVTSCPASSHMCAGIATDRTRPHDGDFRGCSIFAFCPNPGRYHTPETRPAGESRCATPPSAAIVTPSTTPPRIARQGHPGALWRRLAGIAAPSEEARVAAQMALADLPLAHFLDEPLIPYETDEVTRLIVDSHDAAAFAPVAASDRRRLPRLAAGRRRRPTERLAALAPGLTPEMAAAVTKLMRNQDLIVVAAKCRVVTRFRNTIGLAGPALRPPAAQPSHRRPARHRRLDPRRPAARLRRRGHRHQSGHRQPDAHRSRCCGCSTTSSPRYEIPTQSCVLDPCHHARSRLIERGAPVDLVFQSIAGTEAANAQLRRQSRAAARGARRGAVAAARHGRRQRHVFRDRPGLGALGRRPSRRRPADAARPAPTRSRAQFEPLLVNTVVGFIGPEYLYDGKQIIRAGLEDHFCGKLLGLPMGCDVCYTNHAEADQDDMDTLLTLLGVGRRATSSWACRAPTTSC